MTGVMTLLHTGDGAGRELIKSPRPSNSDRGSVAHNKDLLKHLRTSESES